MNNEMPKKIGGDFELTIEDFIQVNDQEPFFSSGRHAYRRILRELKENGANHIWLPDYICKSVINATKQEYYTFSQYSVDYNLHIEKGSISKINCSKSSIILLINYFGLLDLTDDVNFFHEHGFIVIVDQVQSLIDTMALRADYSFNSFRKFLPLPEGAFAYKGLTPIIPNRNGKNRFIIAKIAGGLLKGLANDINKITDSQYLEIFKIGEELLDNENNESASLICAAMYSRIEIEGIIRKRVKNYHLVYRLLKTSRIQPFLPESNCKISPLVVPILLNNRDKIRQELSEHNIFLPVHWPEGYKGIARMFAKNELGIVIDQRYSEKEIQYQIDKIIKADRKYN